jgi:hypothetical protein
VAAARVAVENFMMISRNYEDEKGGGVGDRTADW